MICLSRSNDESWAPVIKTGDALQALADMISDNQSHVSERPHDLVGTLADTCKAKELLHWEAKVNILDAMPKLLANQATGLAGDWEAKEDLHNATLRNSHAKQRQAATAHMRLNLSVRHKPHGRSKIPAAR